MKEKLPKNHQPVAIQAIMRSGAQHFPSIFRFIPEATLSPQIYLHWLKVGVVCLISAVLIAAIISQCLLLINNREYLKKITLERNNIEKEVIYWKRLAGIYNNYPDIYLKIASLEYTLGNSHSANAFIDKALSLNPGIAAGRVLGEHVYPSTLKIK